MSQSGRAGITPSANWQRSCGARRAAFLAVIAVATMMLAGCGSSGSESVALTELSTAGSSSPAGATASEDGQVSELAQTTTTPGALSAGSTEVAGCRDVPRPASRSGEEVSPPHGRLDPARQYTVRLQTNCGPIVIDLFAKQAPQTAAAFAHLVQTGYYDDLTFYRVVVGSLIQSGDPDSNGTGGPRWQTIEPPPANFRYTQGTVAMAKGAGAPSGASRSQFFIVTGTNVSLPDEYALVGHVIDGGAAVEAIAHASLEASTTGEDTIPRVPIVIEHATLSVG